MWVLALLVAGACAVAVEYCNKYLHLPLWPTLARTWPLILLLQIALFYGYREKRVMILTAAVYTVGTAAIRLGTCYALGEPITGKMLLGLCVLVMGLLLMKW